MYKHGGTEMIQDLRWELQAPYIRIDQAPHLDKLESVDPCMGHQTRLEYRGLFSDSSHIQYIDLLDHTRESAFLMQMAAVC